MKGIRWLCLPQGTGFGNAAQAYISGLRAADVPVSWTPMRWGEQSWSPELDFGPTPADARGGPIDHDVVVVHSPPIWHDSLRRDAPAARLVAYTAWEADRMPPVEVALLERYDLVVVPSIAARDALVASGVTRPVRAVPHIAREVPPTSPMAVPGTTADTCCFYVISSWTTRKAVAETVTAYLDAFSASDDVVLVVSTTAEDRIALERLRAERRALERHEGTAWFSLAKLLGGRARVPRVHLDAGASTNEAIDALHARGDCFVSLTRGEAWGLGAFEAAAAGNPVVITGWFGTMEWLPSGYPLTVTHRLASTAEDELDGWWKPCPGQRWARADHDDAVDRLRAVHADRHRAAALGEGLRAHVLATYDSATVTAALIDVLSG
jgi:glycosyltransferase involved in cell wall biosynthesis